MLLLVEVTHAIRARHRAELAADAFLFVDLHRAVRIFVGSARGAYLDALGVFAMLAADGHEIHLDIGEVSAAALGGVGTHAQGLIPTVARGNAVDRLAGDRTAQAADATIAVGHNRVLRHFASLTF